MQNGYIWSRCSETKYGNHNIKDGGSEYKTVGYNSIWRLFQKVFGSKPCNMCEFGKGKWPESKNGDQNIQDGVPKTTNGGPQFKMAAVVPVLNYVVNAKTVTRI